MFKTNTPVYDQMRLIDSHVREKHSGILACPPSQLACSRKNTPVYYQVHLVNSHDPENNPIYYQALLVNHRFQDPRVWPSAPSQLACSREILQYTTKSAYSTRVFQKYPGILPSPFSQLAWSRNYPGLLPSASSQPSFSRKYPILQPSPFNQLACSRHTPWYTIRCA